MKLTIRQQEVVERGYQNGILTHNDFLEFYASLIARHEMIKRFILLGIIEDTNKGYFKVNKEIAITYIQSRIEQSG